MNNKDIMDVIGDIDDRLIEEAAQRRRWSPAARIAAAVAVMTVAAAAIVLAVIYLPGSRLFGTEPPIAAQPTADSEGRLLWVDTREKGGAEAMLQELAIIWPWELQTVREQYGYVYFEGREYAGARQAVPESLLGESLGLCDAVGYDEYKEKEYHKECEVREILGVLPQLTVAVKLDDQYYVYDNNEYDPPETLGEFMDSYSLPETLPLTEFTHYGKNGDSKGRYVIPRECSEEIWRLIGGHRDAAFYEWQPRDHELLIRPGEYVSFRAKSEALGISNLVFYVTSTGYVKTNICGWAYSYEIGEETGKAILDYALANAQTAPATQQKYYLTGTVTEVGEDYFKLDDSIVMKNPEEGKVFTIFTDDIRVRRHFVHGLVDVGSTVSVEYDGLIYADEPDLVRGAWDLHEVVFYGDQVLIPE